VKFPYLWTLNLFLSLFFARAVAQIPPKIVPATTSAPPPAQTPLPDAPVVKAGLLPKPSDTPEPYSQAQIDQWLVGTQNPATLRTLMKCESSNTDVARPDSNGLISYGLLRFNGTATWDAFASQAGVSGTPMNPRAAITVADWMISHGELHRWTCAHIQHLL